MSSPRSIWSDLPPSRRVATVVCYAGVFNDVIDVEDFASKLAESEKAEFQTGLNELQRQGKLIRQGKFAGLPDLEDKLSIKVGKTAMAKQLIASRLERVKRLGRNPLVKFVGISGSLAANNPTRDRNNQLDLDIFLIIRSRCLWIYAILRGLRNLLPRDREEPELCINYVMDESDLLVANRNYYTATEIRNIIPVLGLDVFHKFLRVNNWVDYYYPNLSGTASGGAAKRPGNLINKCFYFLYTLLRCIKWRSTDPLREISSKTDPFRGIGSSLLSPRYGGYQALVQKKFSTLARACFPDLLDLDFIEKLFPDKLSAEIRRGNFDAVKLLVFDYSKYE